MGSNHGSLQNPPLLGLGHRALREFSAVYGTGIGREGALTQGGGGTDNGGANGEGGSEWPASGNGDVGSGAGERGREKNSDPLVG